MIQEATNRHSLQKASQIKVYMIVYDRLGSGNRNPR